LAVVRFRRVPYGDHPRDATTQARHLRADPQHARSEQGGTVGCPRARSASPRNGSWWLRPFAPDSDGSRSADAAPWWWPSSRRRSDAVDGSAAARGCPRNWDRYRVESRLRTRHTRCIRRSRCRPRGHRLTTRGRSAHSFGGIPAWVSYLSRWEAGHGDVTGIHMSGPCTHSGLRPCAHKVHTHRTLRDGYVGRRWPGRSVPPSIERPGHQRLFLSPRHQKR